VAATGLSGSPLWGGSHALDQVDENGVVSTLLRERGSQAVTSPRVETGSTGLCR